jgi:hypothetical protein
MIELKPVTPEIHRSRRSGEVLLTSLSPSWLGLAAAAVLAWCWPSAATAQGCPPGHYPIGGGTAGWVGCAPMDGGVGGGTSPASIENLDITAPGLSTYDADAWSDFFADSADQTIEQEREELDPARREAYDALLDGVWGYGKSRPGAPVPMCMAIFMFKRVGLFGSSGGGFMYLDWGGAEPGTVFAFFDHGVPRVRQVARVRVQLEQDGEIQEVEAFHTAFPLIRDMGMVMLRVPSTQALLSSIQDEGNYRLLMDERELTRSTTVIGRMRDRRGPTGRYQEVTGRTFHGALEARDQLQACLAEQGRLP